MRLEFGVVLLLASLALAVDWELVKSNLGKGINSTADLANDVRSQKVIDIVKSLSSLGSVIPGPVGGVFTGVTAVLTLAGGKTRDPMLVEISAKLSTLAKEVRNVQRAVEKAIDVIKVEVRGLRLKDITAKLRVLQVVYEKFVNEKSPKATADFLYSCAGIHEKPILLYQFITEDTYKYKQEVMAENNEKTYVELVKNVERLLYQATLLETACTSVQYQNATDEQRKDMEQEIIKSSQKYLSEMAQTSEGDLQHYIFDAAKSIVEGFAPGREQENNKDFGPKLFEIIKNNLPSSKLYLLVYGRMSTTGTIKHSLHPWKDDETIRIDTKPEPSFFHHWMHKWGRNIVLVRKGTEGPDHSFLGNQHNCSNRRSLTYVECEDRSVDLGSEDPDLPCHVFDCTKWQIATRDCLVKRKADYIALGCAQGYIYQGANFDLGIVTRLEKQYSGQDGYYAYFVIF